MSTPSRAGTRKAPLAREKRVRPRVVWMALLLCSICFEGLGRKYLTFIPQNLFYFIKDALLVIGLFAYGIRPIIKETATRLYRGFVPFLVLAFAWTLFEVFNPQTTVLLGLVGLRAYWLWWLAPLVVASALEDIRDYKGVVVTLSVVTLIVAGFAMLQFVRPSDDPLNMQLQQYDDVETEVAIVYTTGKARVASTFAYLSGFADFTMLAPPLILSIGLRQSGRVQTLSLVAAAFCAAAIPTSGSRAPVVIGVLSVAAVAWGAGLFRTRVGRRILIGSFVAVVAAVFALPTAVQGVFDRFNADTDETIGRFRELLWSVFPPATMNDVTGYDPMGLGTGMQLNAKLAFGVAMAPYDQEPEPGRYLMELGPVGYVLVFLARIGLIVALFRAAKQLRRSGEGGFAGLAVAYALLLFIGRITFDHIWASLHFTGIGLVLRAASQTAPAPVVVPVLRSRSTSIARTDAAPP